MITPNDTPKYIFDAIVADDVSRLQGVKDAQAFFKRYNFSSFTDVASLAEETPLHLAARLGKLGAIRLLATVYDVNDIFNDMNVPPITLAVRFEQPAAVELLLELGAQAKLKDKFNISALSLAEQFYKHHDVLPMIAQSLSMEDRKACYLHAAINDAPHVIDYFLSIPDWPVDTADRAQQTALYHAAFYNRREMVELLLDRGANPNAENHHGITPLMAAAHNPCLKDIPLFTSLIAAGANPHHVNKDKYTMFDIMRINDIPDDVVAAIQKVVVLHEIKKVHDKLPDFKPIHKIKLKPH